MRSIATSAESSAGGSGALRTTPVPTRKRWRTTGASFVIVGYLGILMHGVVCHALQFRVNAHPLMYFTVWDMFCGWSGWSFRNHIIAEGESGRYYRLTPTPWGEYHPYSNLGREHYDSFRNYAFRIGHNTLKQTQHEPMVRMLLVEETWSKKFNLPSRLWYRLHDAPPDPHHYFHIAAVSSADGRIVRRNSSFHERHRAAWLAASLRGQSPPGHPRIDAVTAFGN